MDLGAIAIGNIITQIFLTSYFDYIIVMLFNRKTRVEVKTKNIKLDKLRVKSNKTLDEQKEFLNQKFGTTEKKKIQWKKIGFTMIRYIIIYLIIRQTFIYFDVNIRIYQAVLVIVIGSPIINYILKKFNLAKNSILDMM